MNTNKNNTEPEETSWTKAFTHAALIFPALFTLVALIAIL